MPHTKLPRIIERIPALDRIQVEPEGGAEKLIEALKASDQPATLIGTQELKKRARSDRGRTLPIRIGLNTIYANDTIEVEVGNSKYEMSGSEYHAINTAVGNIHSGASWGVRNDSAGQVTPFDV